MKKIIIYSLFFAIACVSCSKQDAVESVLIQKTDSITIKSEEEALSDMYSFWQMVYGSTKGNETPRPIVERVDLCGKHYTKNATGEQEESPEVYVVNFENESGYALLNTKYDGPSVLAFIEAGALDVAKMDSILVSASSKYDANPFTEQDEIVDSPDFIYSYLADIVKTQQTCQEQEQIETKAMVGGNYEYISESVGPLISCKWGQEYPFNQYMPYFPNATYTTSLRKRAPAGCGIIAAAQTMMKTHHPSLSTLVNADYTWQQMGSLSTYGNYMYYAPETFDANAGQVTQERMAVLAYGLANLSTAFYASYSPSATGVSMANVIYGLKTLDYSFYSTAQSKLLNWYVSDAISMLSDNKPVIVFGSSLNGNYGHVWVIDGYVEIVHEGGWSEPCLHFNWGYRGVNDGYYLVTTNYFVDGRYAYDDVKDQVVIDHDLSATYTDTYFILY